MNCSPRRVAGVGEYRVRFPRQPRFAVSALALLFFATAIASAPAVVFTVTQPGDDGPGSLRQVINEANSTAGAHTITFATSAAIALNSPLPVLACDVAI